MGNTTFNQLNPMTSTLKNKLALLAITGIAFATVPNVEAIPTIRLFDGTTSWDIVDDSIDDTSMFGLGDVAFSGVFGDWVVDVSGTTKPMAGSASSPSMFFFASASSIGSGTLSISFSEDGFGFIPLGGSAYSAFGGTADAFGSVSYNAYTDSALFGTGTSLASYSYSALDVPFSFDDTAFQSLSFPASFSLTQEVVFTHGSSGGLSSFHADSGAASVPDAGSTLALLGASLTALGAVRRKIKG